MKVVRARLLLVAHHGLFRSGLGSCGEFTELGQSLQTRSFGVASAAAGAGNQGGGSEGDQSKDADHVVVFF